MPQCLRKGHGSKRRQPSPGTMVTTCMSYCAAGGPGKEHRTNKPPPARGDRERSKEGGGARPRVLPTSQSPSTGVHLDWAMRTPPGRVPSQDAGQRQPGNSSHQHQNRDWEPHGRAVPLGPLTLLSSARAPLPVKSLPCVHVSLDRSRLSVRQEPSLGPWKGFPILTRSKIPGFTNADIQKTTSRERAWWTWSRKDLGWGFQAPVTQPPQH